MLTFCRLEMGETLTEHIEAFSYQIIFIIINKMCR